MSKVDEVLKASERVVQLRAELAKAEAQLLSWLGGERRAAARPANNGAANGAVRPSAGERVVAYLRGRPGAELRAADVAKGMGLAPKWNVAVKKSLDRQADKGTVKKRPGGLFVFRAKR